MDDSHDESSVDNRYRVWRGRHTSLLKRATKAFEKLSAWITTVNDRSVEQKAERTSSLDPSEQIVALTKRVKSLEAIADAIPDLLLVALTTLGPTREESDKLIDARESGTLTHEMLNKGDEVLTTAERKIASLEDGLDSLPDL